MKKLDPRLHDIARKAFNSMNAYSKRGEGRYLNAKVDMDKEEFMEWVSNVEPVCLKLIESGTPPAFIRIDASKPFSPDNLIVGIKSMTSSHKAILPNKTRMLRSYKEKALDESQSSQVSSTNGGSSWLKKLESLYNSVFFRNSNLNQSTQSVTLVGLDEFDPFSVSRHPKSKK